MTFEQIMQQEHFIPNAEQRPVIESTVNTVVSAGAGAGKTAVLSWRFLRLVMECNILPEQILTLTFTKKAASEMRERIYRRLLEARESLRDDIFGSFSKATISTLDSFCAQIVRSDCIAYGLPRDIAVISDDDFEDLSQRLAMQFLDDPGNKEERRAIASLFMPSDLMDRFFGLIAKETSLAGDYDAERITKKLLAHVRNLYEDRMEQIGKLLYELGTLNLKGSMLEQYNNICLLYQQRSFNEGDYFRLSGVRDEEVKEIAKLINTLIGKDSGFVMLQNLAARGDDKVSLLQTSVQKYASLLNLEKQRQGMLTFKDMGELAVLILKNNLALRNEFKKRFRQIMVDEFQDNNMIQRDLVFLLAEKHECGTPGSIPEIHDLDPSKLFFVGDEKQSIYRFRGADVSVFRRLQKEISENGQTLELSTNYRSQGKLIDHFNKVFEKVLVNGGRPFEASFSPIKAGRTPDGTESRIIFGVYNRDLVEDEELKDGVLEAEAIGDYCNRILNTDEFLVDGKRPEPDEVAILFGKTTNQMNIEKALKRRGIGYQITETRSLMLDAVASDFYCLINCLLYPEDTRSFIALLKSPFCGLCEQSIEAVISGEGDVLEIDRERYGAFRVFFDNLKKEAFSLSVSGLLEKIYIEGGYKAYLSRNADSLSFAEHYDYLFSYAVQHDAEGRSLSDYARFLRNKLGSSGKLPETEVLHARKSGVQVMTVHKSKGLEFKVVIYAGVGNKGANDRASYVFSYDGDLIASEDKGIQKILEEDSREKEEAEARRLMYVAMTRAKDHLIVTGSYKTGSTADVFSWYLNAIGGDLNTLECTMDGVEMEDLSTTAKLSNKTFDQETYEPKKTEFTEFRERITRVGVTGLEKTWSENDGPIDGVNLPDFEVDSIIGQSNLNDRFGTLCHEALELLVKTGSMEDLQCHLLESEKANAMLVEQARAFARSFLESPFYEQFVKGHKTQTEVRFYSSSEELGDVVMEGVIDLLVEGEDYNLVVDYKTDRVKAPQIHKRQITTYVKVARQLYKKNCYGVLYYLRDGSLSEFWDSEGNTWKPDSRK